MLLNAIRSLFGSTSNAGTGEAEAPPAADPLHLAACVLLLDVAYADGEFSPSERSHLEDVLERHFGLPPEVGRRLLDLAERERQSAVDYFRFTSQLQQSYDLGQKMVLAEVMWGVILADGKLGDHEAYLVRKLARLMELEPAYLSQARKKVSEKGG